MNRARLPKSTTTNVARWPRELKTSVYASRDLPLTSYLAKKFSVVSRVFISQFPVSFLNGFMEQTHLRVGFGPFEVTSFEDIIVFVLPKSLPTAVTFTYALTLVQHLWSTPFIPTQRWSGKYRQMFSPGDIELLLNAEMPMQRVDRVRKSIISPCPSPYEEITPTKHPVSLVLIHTASTATWLWIYNKLWSSPHLVFVDDDYASRKAAPLPPCRMEPRQFNVPLPAQCWGPYPLSARKNLFWSCFNLEILFPWNKVWQLIVLYKGVQ